MKCLSAAIVACIALVVAATARADESLFQLVRNATSRWGPAPQTPHPAVVRVIAPERGGASLGSGTLIDVSARAGLIVTNWHVVKDATGGVVVVFPDGFQSAGRVIRMDRDWDLALIVIGRPRVDPVPVSGVAPRPGEVLTIAGFGSGAYRAQSGRCTQYVSPGMNLPYEMVELAATARQGDSGGPIFNTRGELAGVLFGEGGGRTSGAYCGRVRQMMDSVGATPTGISREMIAAGPPAQSYGPPTQSAGDPAQDFGPPTQEFGQPAQFAASPPRQMGVDRTPNDQTARFETGRPLASTTPGHGETARRPLPAATRNQELVRVPMAGNPPGTGPASGRESTLFDQAKSVLAAVGALALLFHTTRWLARE